MLFVGHTSVLVSKKESSIPPLMLTKHSHVYVIAGARDRPIVSICLGPISVASVGCGKYQNNGKGRTSLLAHLNPSPLDYAKTR